MGNAKLKEVLDVEDEIFSDELAAGSTLMHGQYTIDSFLNAGGFGITYSARDSLDRRVVIKECFPGAFCRRSTALVTARSRAHQKELASIVRLFVQEAKSLAKLDHPNIVGVHQVFEENNTAYMALDFVEGRDLLDVIESGDTSLTPDEVEAILRKVLDAISFVHAQGMLHRDISPDNILLDASKTPVLIDFGAAREQATQKSRVLSALRVVKDGYSPQEFYISGSEQGPYSDLYALGASIYHLITGELPADAQARLATVAAGDADPYKALATRSGLPYQTKFLAAIDKAMEILPRDRMQSAQNWLDMLDGTVTPLVTNTEAKPKPAAAQQPAGSGSKLGLLMASVAVVAVIAAGVVATQTDLLGSATPETATASVGASEPTSTEVVAAAPAPATEPTPAPEVADAPASDAPIVTTEVKAPIPATEPVQEIAQATAPVLDAPSYDVALATTAEPDVAVAPDAPAPEVSVASPELTAFEATTTFVPFDAVLSVEPVISLRPPQKLGTPALVEAVIAEPLTAAEPPPALAATDETTFEIPGMVSNFTVALPYEGFFTAKDGETRIFAVNGVSVDSRTEFDAALQSTMVNTQEQSVEVTVTLGVSPDSAEDKTLSLPTVQRTVLTSGLAFEAAQSDDAWVTRIVSVPDSVDADLQVGDVLIGHVASAARVDERDSLPRIIEAAAAGAKDLTFAVSRDDKVWAVSLPFSNRLQN